MHPTILEAQAYWERKRTGRRMPARRDLDPVIEIPKLLPWIMLTDVLHRPLDFRYRLIGTRIIELARQNYTGKLFSELAHTGPDSHVWRDRAEVVERRAPKYVEPPYTGANKDIKGALGLHMPLSEDDETVDMIMTVVVFSF